MEEKMLNPFMPSFGRFPKIMVQYKNLCKRL